MCWLPSMPIIFRCTGNRKSTNAKAWNWIARHWPIGSAAPAVRWNLWSMRFDNMCWRRTKLHGDDIPVPVLAPGNGKTKTGRLWTYVRDDRPAGSTEAPAVWFAYSPDRKSEHPADHLANFRGTLQADGFAGFNRLYEKGEIVEAACWAHVRRKFHDLFEAHASPIAKEALERIAALYGIEKEIRGRPPDERREIRNARARPLLESLQPGLKSTHGRSFLENPK